MIKIKRKLILLLCIIFLFNSSVTGRAKETTLQKAFITVGLSDRTTQMYRVILKNSEIYISAKDLAGITGYKYIEDGCIEFVAVLSVEFRKQQTADDASAAKYHQTCGDERVGHQNNIFHKRFDITVARVV